jgi:hypothetical protein
MCMQYRTPRVREYVSSRFGEAEHANAFVARSERVFCMSQNEPTEAFSLGHLPWTQRK